MRADPATLLTFLDDFLLFKSLEAFVPTFLEVFSFLAILSPPFYINLAILPNSKFLEMTKYGQ